VPTSISITPTQIGDGAVSLTVTDADGDAKAIPLTFTSKSSLTAQPRNLTTDANSNLTITIAGASASIGIEIEKQVCADDFQSREVCLVSENGTRAAIINPTDTGFTYRVPTNFSTQRKGDLTDRLSPETFRYRLVNKNNAADVSDFATITIRIKATGSFTEAVAAFTSTCTSACHKVGGTAPNYPGFPYSTADSNDPQWRFGNILSGRARVDLGTAAQSGLACWPQQNCSTPAVNMQHVTGGKRDPDEIAPILRWIQSGANNDVDPP
jgi:hypothetical protein